MKAGVGQESINVSFEDQEAAGMARSVLSEISQRIQIDRDTVRLYLEQAAAQVPSVINHLQKADIDPISLTLTQPTLDDVFLQVTGQSLQAQESTTVEMI